MPANPDIVPDDFSTPKEEDLEIIHPKRRVWPWLLGCSGLGFVALVAVVLLLMTRGGPADWQTAPVVAGTLTTKVTAVGQLGPENVVEVGSDQSGKLASVDVEENTVVEAGQILAQLETTPFEHRVSQYEAQLASARASKLGPPRSWLMQRIREVEPSGCSTAVPPRATLSRAPISTSGSREPTSILRERRGCRLLHRSLMLRPTSLTPRSARPSMAW